MTITRPVGIERKIGARGRHEVHDPGSLHIIASGSEGRWQFDTPLDSMHLRMTPAFLLRSFGEEGEGVRLADVDLALEPRASSLLATLLQKVRDESAVDLEAESMAVRIARLLLDHAAPARPSRLGTSLQTVAPPGTRRERASDDRRLPSCTPGPTGLGGRNRG